MAWPIDVIGVRTRRVAETYGVGRAAKLTLVVLRGEHEVRRLAFGRRRRGLVYRRVLVQEEASFGGERHARLELRVGRRRIMRAVSARWPL